MSFYQFSHFQNNKWPATRDALHSYAKVLGIIRAQLVPKQKHWWHVSLLPVSNGFSTGPIYQKGEIFEIILDLANSRVIVQWHDLLESVPLSGQSASTLFVEISGLLFVRKIEVSGNPEKITDQAHPDFDVDNAVNLAKALGAIGAVFQQFKNEQRRETSPVQLWPHHFDLAVLWFSGRLVPEQDPDDEENADEQMNFGFSVGDQQTPEPYFYFTAYPTPENFNRISLPSGAQWNEDGWQGVYLSYSILCQQKEPAESLLEIMREVVKSGAKLMQ
ncbi:DUF5996 family protein [Aliikangiella coralliicola]|uniref:Uncharacterized protein n=1 Tax=Aliikangiella coralliicola TaxID=2592383 RepID=A0A545U970_9GAMM|nr:DUF5996 family protein [Aliikangiella coralliicola]TQV85979.1 hypothetical protein FLL46_18885 [Aliikangiella coralliicola]